ncbi:type I restriction enzyme, S subunit [Chryseobacterium contaminans]|uniref:Type I restriction enzyme, S subunit n=1 Tax=Chryseobacterium contaminans TaxID=1423959 RepID=A0A1M6ZLC1_9FLAO|nr:restriction endonuclease subunit S [Chryseobacterium contaminans]SHL31194.1 type I restriction enzyme, S subunit [Chryseobacterium contaminans]
MTNKKLKVSNVPNLRFPGFEGEWETKKLEEIGEIVTGSTPPTNNRSYYEGEYLFVSPVDIQTNRYIEVSKTTLTEKGFKKGRKIKKGSSLFVCIGSTIGKVGQANRDCITNQQINSIVTLENNEDFLFSLLEFYSPKIKALSAEQAVPIINKTTFSNVQVNIPELPEQKKIASFLSLIDERIVTQNKIIKELKSSKHSFIKKIFTRELRFRDNNDKYYPEWHEKRMKDLFTFKVTNSFSREKLNYENGTVKNIHYGDIHTKFQTLFDIKKEIVPYINSNINITKISEDSYCKEGDMIFADASEDLNDVGKSIEIINLNNQRILAGLHTILARPISNIFSIGFCGYLFKSQKVRAQIQKESQGSKVLSISVNRLANLSLSIPCLEEQIKIANLFSSMDLKLNTEKQILQELEKQKKFLLQQMFV